MEPGAPQPIAKVRFRAWVLGLILAVVSVYGAVELPQSSMTSLLAVPVGLLILHLLFAGLWHRFTGRSILNSGEHLVMFGLASFGCAVGGEWSYHLHTVVHSLPFLRDGNPVVRDTMMPNLPDSLIVKDLDKVKGLMIGGQGAPELWAMMPDLGPRYLGWALLLATTLFAFLCINSLMRKAWLDREKLSFPLIQLPVAMAHGGPGSMWRSRTMWTAFAIMMAIGLLNGFSYLYPWLPRIPVKQIIETGPLLQEAPWSSMGELHIAIFPFLAAIGIFMPSDLLFSLIVFFLIRKGLHLIVGMNGIPQNTFAGTAIMPGPPYFEEQAWGGILAMFLATLWFSRGVLKEVWGEIRTGAKPDDGGPKHRTAFIGLMVCFVAFVWFGLQGALPVPYLIAYFTLFLVFSVVVARLRAQLGPPTHEFAFFGPSGFLHRITGTEWLNPQQTTWVNQAYIFMNRLHRNHPMPFQLEALKMARLEGVPLNRMVLALGVVSVVALLSAYWFSMSRNLRLGSPLTVFEGVAYTQTMMANRRGPDPMGMGMTIFGALFVFGLDAIRVRFPGFPIHPAGYVLGFTYGIDYYWFGLLLALLIKSFVQRYYGRNGYDSLRHVALGVLLAEYANELIWMTFTVITKQSSYTIGINERGLGLQ